MDDTSHLTLDSFTTETNPEISLYDRALGCILGGAVGDALGGPVEFMGRDEIRKEYGPEGIEEFGFEYGRRGAITDDTQMTLFTIEGLIRVRMQAAGEGHLDLQSTLRRAYLRWLITQGYTDPTRVQETEGNGWVIKLKELHSRRAPGMTCLGSLLSKDPIKAAENNSMGCGGVMRSAPFGLILGDSFTQAKSCAAITHGHPYGQIAAGYFALVIHRIVHEGMILIDAVQDRDNHLAKDLELCIAIEQMTRAVQANTDLDIEEFGQGWIANEALAMALYASVRTSSFEEGIRFAVNHSGDSDSVGAITGNILGALYGVQAIPSRFLEELELRDEIIELTSDLYEIVICDKTPNAHMEPEAFAALCTRYPG